MVRPGRDSAYVAGVGLAFRLGTLVSYLPLHLADLGYGGTQTGLAFSSLALVATIVRAGPVARMGSPGRWLKLPGAGLAWPGLYSPCYPTALKYR